MLKNEIKKKIKKKTHLVVGWSHTRIPLVDVCQQLLLIICILLKDQITHVNLFII